MPRGEVRNMIKSLEIRGLYQKRLEKPSNHKFPGDVKSKALEL